MIFQLLLNGTALTLDGSGGLSPAAVGVSCTMKHPSAK